MKESMEIIIRKLQQTTFSYDDVVSLLHESFVERQEQGLQFTCSTITVEYYQKKTCDGIIFVAYDADNNVLLGTAALSLRKDDEGVLYSYYHYIAVASIAKHQGIGTLLFREIEGEALKRGAQYILSDTAESAKSSVRYHLKQGFQVVNYETFSNTNYYSYIFRKQLIPNASRSGIRVKWHFFRAYVKTRLKYHVHRKPTLLYRIYMKLKELK